MRNETDRVSHVLTYSKTYSAAWFNIIADTSNQEWTMNTKLSSVIKEQLSKTTIVKDMPGQGAQPQNTMNRAVDSIVSEFTSVANDSVGLQRLYNAVKPVDKASSPHEAGVQLRNIVGDKGEQRLVTQFRAGSNLTEPQAKSVLAAVSPSVITALRSELGNGSTENSAAGLATLLNSKDRDTSVNSTDTTQNTHTGNQTVHTSGGAAVAATGTTGIMRFAPLLLLGALFLGAIKYCSDSEKSRVVAEERSNLQQQLAGVQEESELQTTKFASLQNEYDSAQSQIEQLEGDLQSSKAEVDALRDVPTGRVIEDRT